MARFGRGLRCPRCGATHVQKWGRFSGRQRYRCRGPCGRTFSDLTLTPAAYIKKLSRWPGYQRLLADGMTLRAAAAVTGVHLSTAFRWRHRLLEGLVGVDEERPGGTIEMTLIRFPESFKGARSLPRRPRKRRIDALGWWTEPRFDVLVVVDRVGRLCTIPLGISAGGRRSPRDIVLALTTVLSPNEIRFTEGTGHGVRWELVRVAMEARAVPVALSGADRERGGNALAYRLRLALWLRRFRGVASRYLARYLVWHRHLDRGVRRGLAEDVVRWPVP